jgi:hypothetical protein
VRPFAIELADAIVEFCLLLQAVHGWRPSGLLLEREMHALMPSPSDQERAKSAHDAPGAAAFREGDPSAPADEPDVVSCRRPHRVTTLLL